MGQDTSVPGFHEALLSMLKDPSLTVRGNAALSLVRFGDATGKPQILELLQPAKVPAPQSGKIIDASVVGIAIRQGGIVAKLQTADHTVEIRSPVTGRLRELHAQVGQDVAAGDVVAVIDPAGEQVWEALRALYLIGQPADIAAVQPYEREMPDISDHVRQQAVETDRAIRERAK
jgi:multidrug efflux pump subunit AcrA (membrane-fusion protein)